MEEMNDNNLQEPQQPRQRKPMGGRSTQTNMILGIVAGVALVGAIVLFFIMNSAKSDYEAQIEQLSLANEQLSLANEYQALDNEFAQYENQTALLVNDSLVEKYAAAKAKVEKLLQELNNEKTKNAARVKQLQSEIATLKGILRNYVAQIDSLGRENANLRDENKEIKNRNEKLNRRVNEVTNDNKVLSERMTLAEKLNVTGVNLKALKKNGKEEKNITKAKQLMVTFTIPQNNSTPVGEKMIYLRITNPEGNLLGNSGSFDFEGASVQCTARKSIEYAGEEIGGIQIYWDVNTTLTPGEYTVELFADNYRLVSRRFTMKK